MRGISPTLRWVLGWSVVVMSSVFSSGASAQTWSLATTLAREGSPSDQSFGLNVATDGETIMVGAQSEASPASNAGAVYVYTVEGSTQTQKIVLANQRTNDQLGGSIGLLGDHAILGTKRISGGFAVFFERRSGAWMEGQRFDARSASPDASEGAFGNAVLMGRDLALVTAPKEKSDTGAVYVYAREGGTWTLRQRLEASDATKSDFFGLGIALSGDTLAVGAPGNLLYPTERGGVYVFERRSGSFVETAHLTFPEAGGPPDVAFGGSVAIDESTLAVGAAPGKMKGNGRVILYSRAADTWQVAQSLSMPDEESFGVGVLLHRDTLSTRASTGYTRGLHVFTRQAGMFAHVQRIEVDNPSMSIAGGAALYGGTLVIGLGYDMGGKAFVYRNARLDAGAAATDGGAGQGAESSASTSSQPGAGCSVSAPAADRGAPSALLLLLLVAIPLILRRARLLA